MEEKIKNVMSSLRAILIEHGFRLENRKYTQRLENACTLFSSVRSKIG